MSINHTHATTKLTPDASNLSPRTAFDPTLYGEVAYQLYLLSQDAWHMEISENPKPGLKAMVQHLIQASLQGNCAITKYLITLAHQYEQGKFAAQHGNLDNLSQLRIIQADKLRLKAEKIQNKQQEQEAATNSLPENYSIQAPLTLSKPPLAESFATPASPKPEVKNLQGSSPRPILSLRKEGKSSPLQKAELTNSLAEKQHCD